MNTNTDANTDANTNKRKKLSDIVIFSGMAINAIVIVLILYFFVF